MVDLVVLFRESGPMGLLELAAMVIAGPVVLVTGVAHLANRRAPAALPALSLGLIPLASIAAVLVGREMGLHAIAHASAELRQTLLAAGTSAALIPQLLPALFVTAPALVFLLLAAIAGAMRGPRRTVQPGIAAGLTVLLAAVPAVAAALTGVPAAWPLRSALYLVAGLLVAASLLGEDRETSAPHAGAAAAMVLPVLVGATELGALAAQHLHAFEAVAHAPAEVKASMLRDALELVDTTRPFAWIATGLAACVGVVGVGGALDDHAPRNVGVVGGLAATLVALVALSVDAASMLEAMSTVLR